MHPGMSGPWTLGQLLDAPNPRDLPAAQVSGLWFRLLAAGVGAQGRAPQRTHADPVLEARGWSLGPLWRAQDIWEWRGTLHHRQQHGGHPSG